MIKSLIIVESPTKEKTISKILGKNFIVKSSYGHVRDLPKNDIGVDIENNFKPKYVIIPKAKKLITNLKILAKKVNKIYLATDFDREGEAIAWHLKEILKIPNSRFLRSTFTEITPEAIIKSIKHPKNKLNMLLVSSQQTRRLLDRIVGYELSPFLWKKVKFGLSAGRVQSVVLSIICDREKEIIKFKPVEYWDIKLEVSKSGINTIVINAQIFSKDKIRFDKFTIKNKEQSNIILKDLEDAIYTVQSIERKEYKRSPQPPYITSTMQQDAFKKLGFSTSKTMFIGQRLYEGICIGKNIPTGLITYIRTDSLNVAMKAYSEALKFIRLSFGESFVPNIPRTYKTKSKIAQEAHEAIRPTFIDKTPLKIKQFLSFDEFKLYDLIWKRFLASQMADSIYNRTIIKISAKNYLFESSSDILFFNGFLKIFDTMNNHIKEQKELLQLNQNDKLHLIQITSKQYFTCPPNRYNEASLIKILEKYGIGRPSTYSTIFKIISNKLYVKTMSDKKISPTYLGIAVNNILLKYFKNIINVKFTAIVEKELDKIVKNKIKAKDVLKKFYKSFKNDLLKATKNNL
ncbi:MAG: type I DNA topoisomerase [Endomicrobium sp.]|jgi:DNA topoisomerase-1|nr:type I DNA topoisomerase [Endomicrobium sp.]